MPLHLYRFFLNESNCEITSNIKALLVVRFVQYFSRIKRVLWHSSIINNQIVRMTHYAVLKNVIYKVVKKLKIKWISKKLKIKLLNQSAPFLYFDWSHGFKYCLMNLDFSYHGAQTMRFFIKKGRFISSFFFNWWCFLRQLPCSFTIIPSLSTFDLINFCLPLLTLFSLCGI